jgi:hypothetical protein
MTSLPCHSVGDQQVRHIGAGLGWHSDPHPPALSKPPISGIARGALAGATRVVIGTYDDVRRLPWQDEFANASSRQRCPCWRPARDDHCGGRLESFGDDQRFASAWAAKPYCTAPNRTERGAIVTTIVGGQEGSVEANGATFNAFDQRNHRRHVLRRTVWTIRMIPYRSGPGVEHYTAAGEILGDRTLTGVESLVPDAASNCDAPRLVGAVIRIVTEPLIGKCIVFSWPAEQI